MNNWPNIYPITNPALGRHMTQYQKGCVNWFQCTNTKAYIDAYLNCPPLSSIIGKKASAFVAGEFEVVNPSTGKAVRGVYKDWEKWLQNPNYIQSKNHFFKQLYSYLAINGWCYVLKIQPIGFNDGPPSAWWILPVEYIEIELIKNGRYPPTKDTKLRKVFFCLNGIRTQIKDEDLILFTDSGCPIVDPLTLLPYSRIRDLKYPISNLIGSFESRAVLIQSRGAMGILSSSGSSDAVGPLPLTEEEKVAIQNQYRNYGLTGDQWQVIITQASLNWQPMIQDVKKLQLHEEYLSDYKDICDRYNYPFPLTAHSDQSTFNNINGAERALYQNEIIPNSEDILGPLNKSLNTDKVIIRMDYDNVAALQQSEADKGKALKVNNEAYKIMYDEGGITLNEWRVGIGLDKVTDPAFDEYKKPVAIPQISSYGNATTAPSPVN
jgi:hypothetical protein